MQGWFANIFFKFVDRKIFNWNIKNILYRNLRSKLSSKDSLQNLEFTSLFYVKEIKKLCYFTEAKKALIQL